MFIILFYSCSSYKFAKQTVFVEDVDKFFYPKEKVNVWLYMNFVPLENADYGLRTTSLYKTDANILKLLKLNSKQKVLFSAVPSQYPKYHLISLVHNKAIEVGDDYHKQTFENSHYFQKDFKSGRLDIRHVYIPFENNEKGLSLVYYISAEQHLDCRYCKLDYLAKINAKELQSNVGYGTNWMVSDSEGIAAKLVNIKLPADVQKIKDRLYMKIIAQYETTKGINYFQFFGPTDEKEINVKLLPNTYYIEYLNRKYQILRTDTIVVK